MLHSGEDVTSYFASLPTPIVYVTPDLSRAVGLETIIPHYAVVCYERHAYLPLLRERGVKVFCLEEELDKLPERTAAHMLEQQAVQQFISGFAGKAQPAIMLFKPSRKAEIVARQRRYRLLANPIGLNRRFEEKTLLGAELEQAGIKPIPSKVIVVDEVTYQDLQQQFGEQFVVQFSMGFAGNSTLFITNDADFDHLCREHKGRTVKVAKWIDGPSWTLNACVTRYGVVYSRIFAQIIGFREYNVFPGGTSGNDYAYDFGFGAEVEARVYECVEQLGSYMQRIGYRGIFGLDMALDLNDEQVYVIETNARLVASIPVYTALQREYHLVPMLALHVLEFLDESYQIEPQEINELYHETFAAAQLILRNIHDKPLHNPFALGSGIYSHQLGFKRPGYTIRELRDEQEVLLTTSQAETISTNIEYANVQFRRGILQDENILFSDVKILGTKIRKSF
jgi:hypothetical protein